MINHGLSTGALFLCIGMIYERYHTKDMDKLGGLFRRMPVWSFFMVFFTLSSLGLPGLNGFVGEFLCLMGCFTADVDAVAGYPGLLGPWYAIIAVLGLIVSAMYLLIMLGKIVWGPLREPLDHAHTSHAASSLPRDLSLREISILTPIALVSLFIGFYPNPMLDPIGKDIEESLASYPKLVEEYRQNGSLVWPESAKSDGVARTELDTPTMAKSR
jgi:NADH-quinone oxidoreductase subunit M